MNFRLTVTIHDEDGSLWAEVVELPGCFAQGRNLDELHEAVREAITLYMQDGDVTAEDLAKLAVDDEPDNVIVGLFDDVHTRPRRTRVEDMHLLVEA